MIGWIISLLPDDMSLICFGVSGLSNNAAKMNCGGPCLEEVLL